MLAFVVCFSAARLRSALRIRAAEKQTIDRWAFVFYKHDTPTGFQAECQSIGSRKNLRTCFETPSPRSRRRKEADISAISRRKIRLLTSAATILKHALRY